MARGPHKAADQDEDDEEEEFDPRHGKPRQRKQSLVEFLAEPPPWEAVHDMLAPPKKPKVADSATIRPPRVRAKTEAPPPPSFKHHDLLRKPSFTFGKAPPNKGQPPTPPPQSTAFPTVPQIKRPAKSRESFDYDDSFDDDSVGGHHGVSAPKAAPKSQPGKPHLAPSTRELVAFLDEGGHFLLFLRLLFSTPLIRCIFNQAPLMWDHLLALTRHHITLASRIQP
jgi:hypothetical protein